MFQRRTGVKEGSSIRRASLGASRVYVFMGGMILGKGRGEAEGKAVLCYGLLRTMQVSTGVLLKMGGLSENLALLLQPPPAETCHIYCGNSLKPRTVGLDKGIGSEGVKDEGSLVSTQASRARGDEKTYDEELFKLKI